MKRIILLFGILSFAFALELSEQNLYETDENGHVETSSELSYEEILDLADDLWLGVENGGITPDEGEKMFEDETGWDVFEWLTAEGAITINYDDNTAEADSSSFIQSSLRKNFN